MFEQGSNQRAKGVSEKWPTRRNLTFSIGGGLHTGLGYLRDRVWTWGIHKSKTWLINRFSRCSNSGLGAKENNGGPCTEPKTGWECQDLV